MLLGLMIFSSFVPKTAKKQLTEHRYQSTYCVTILPNGTEIEGSRCLTEDPNGACNQITECHGNDY